MRPTHAGVYHVTARSNAEEQIFRNDRDYADAVQILASLVREGFLRCHGFCLMPTHYHLLAGFDENGLRPAIQRFNRRYAGHFNYRHARRGHVFDSPFRSVVVDDPGHGDWLPHYIAANPPRRPWPWSSYDTPFSFVEPLPWLL
jgi:hypothetical protein